MFNQQTPHKNMSKKALWCFTIPTGVREPTPTYGVQVQYRSKTYTFVVGDGQAPNKRFNFEHQLGFIQCAPHVTITDGQALTILRQENCLNVRHLSVIDWRWANKNAYQANCFKETRCGICPVTNAFLHTVEEAHTHQREHEALAYERGEDQGVAKIESTFNYLRSSARCLVCENKHRVERQKKKRKNVFLADEDDPDAKTSSMTEQGAELPVADAKEPFTGEHFSVSTVANDMANASARFNYDDKETRLKTFSYLEEYANTHGLKNMNRSNVAYLACCLPECLNE